MTLAPISTGGLAASVTQVSGTPTPQSGYSGQIILEMNWSANGISSSDYEVSYIGQVVADYMMTTPVNGVLLASLPIHLVGHSRGVALNDAIAQALGQSGVWVDQETYLDPRPIAGFDPNPTVYDNVAFADDYWRTDGNSADDDANGQPVDGAYSLDLPWLNNEAAGFDIVHATPPAYYIGTIDPTITNDGDGPIYSEWYGDTPDMPARNQTGWLYTAIVGGTRPQSGVWPEQGGTGDRTPAGQSGTQWPNVTSLAVTNGSSFPSGEPIDLSYLYQDRGGTADKINYFLDTDQNPYDGFAGSLGSATLAKAATATTGTPTISTVGVAPGTYYLCAEITNSAGFVRYDYTGQTISFTPATPPTLAGPAAAPPTPVDGTTTHLSVSASDAEGASNLTYTWSVLREPSGAAMPTFSGNGTEKASITTAHFYKYGAYDFMVTIEDKAGLTVTSDVDVDVARTAMGIALSPSKGDGHVGVPIDFSGVVVDQFGKPMPKQPTVHYSIYKGDGKISVTGGVFIPTAAGQVVIEAKADGFHATSDIKILREE